METQRLRNRIDNLTDNLTDKTTDTNRRVQLKQSKPDTNLKQT